jgi:hypothetical protein
VSFVLTVATEAIAVLAATLATGEHARWLVYAALAPFALGLASYAFVLARFDWRQLFVGQGDHWVGGGALAISALAAGTIALAARHLGIIASTPEVALLAIWAAAVVWLRYDVRRWATVFPLGMFASCSFVIGDAVGADGIRHFARAWSWVAFAVWLVTLGAAVFIQIGRCAARGRAVE